MIKLLAVDDEPGICDILKKTFSPIGFTVLTATNGEDALMLIEQEKPKIVFLDIRMLGLSGLEVLKEIKKKDRSIKVIMITVMDDEKTKREAKRLGADEFVTKPFLSENLEEIVMKMVGEIIKPRILVVDDEKDVVDSLSNLITKKFNGIAEKALSGSEALDKLKKDSFDLVLMDIKMPGLSGIDVIKQAVKFTPQTKFVAISAYDSKEVADEALKAGAIDFIPKPTSIEALGLKIRQILSQIGKV